MPVFYKGRSDLGRLPTFSQTDLNVQHGFRLPGHTRVELEANILNLFDQDTATQISNAPYRDAIPTNAATGFFNGVNIDAIAAATPSIRKDPRYKQSLWFPGCAQHAVPREVHVLTRVCSRQFAVSSSQ